MLIKEGDNWEKVEIIVESLLIMINVVVRSFFQKSTSKFSLRPYSMNDPTKDLLLSKHDTACAAL
jgi:hypothetical protein